MLTKGLHPNHTPNPDPNPNPDNPTLTLTVQVLTKELHVLRDVAGRDEIAKVLHGMSQVVQGVVVRASKRMTMRDKAKDKSLAAKEQQVKEMRAEAEQMREQLFQVSSEWL